MMGMEPRSRLLGPLVCSCYKQGAMPVCLYLETSAVSTTPNHLPQHIYRGEILRLLTLWPLTLYTLLNLAGGAMRLLSAGRICPFATTKPA